MSLTGYILVFVTAVLLSVLVKLLCNPLKRVYRVKWNESVGTVETDINYGKNEGNEFDLYLPADKSRKDYGLVVYLHAGGFTTGDKKDDVDVLKWFCAKGYVAAGVNYTLGNSYNGVNVYTQSQDIKKAIPKVVAKAERMGYKINGMMIAGGSAGGTMALLYAFRDAASAPVPVKMVMSQVGPASFEREDWDIYGLDKNAYGAASMFSGMSGKEITTEMIEDGSYAEAVKNISADKWVNENSVPALLAYGKHDKVCPCATGRRLAATLEKYNVPHDYIEFPHSGHGLQNDNKYYFRYLDKLDEYLEKYLPVN